MRGIHYPNRQRMSKLVATEMRLFNSRIGLGVVTWCTVISLWLEILFAFFFFLSRGRDIQNLNYVMLLVVVLVVYLLAVAVKSHFSRSNDMTYDISMFFASITFLVNAFSAHLFFCTSWFWCFDGVVPGGSASIVKYVSERFFWLPVAAVAFYAVILLFEPRSSTLYFGRFYILGMLLPISAVASTLIVGTIKYPKTQATVTKVLATATISMLLFLAVRYAAKGIFYRILNASKAEKIDRVAAPSAAEKRIVEVEDKIAEQGEKIKKLGKKQLQQIRKIAAGLSEKLKGDLLQKAEKDEPNKAAEKPQKDEANKTAEKPQKEEPNKAAEKPQKDESNNAAEKPTDKKPKEKKTKEKIDENQKKPFRATPKNEEPEGPKTVFKANKKKNK